MDDLDTAMTDSADPLATPVALAAKATFDFNDPSNALESVMDLALQACSADRAALYEFAEKEGGFTPRMARGIPLSDLGRLPSTFDNPVLRSALRNHKPAFSAGGAGGLGLPLSPGNVVCAPCVASAQTVGLLFLASSSSAYTDEQITSLEILASRAAEILSYARQAASQSYIFHKLSLLYQASHSIAGTRDQKEIVRQLAAHLLKATPADLCEITITGDEDQKTTRFRQQLSKSIQQTVIALVADSLPEYPIHSQVLSKFEPRTISLRPPKGSARDLALLEAEGFASADILPFSAHNEALGLVRLLYTDEEHSTSDQELELAQAIINIGAIGLEDAINLEASQERTSQLQLMNEIGREMTSTLDLDEALENTMRHAQRMLGAEACILFLLDGRGEHLVLKASGGSQMRLRDVSIRLEEGIAGWVSRNRRPLIVNDVRTNPLYHSAIDAQTGLLTTCVICVPLESRGEVRGVIEAINHPRGVFTESDQQMLASVASWASIAVDNANLFERVAEERTRLETTLVETADSVVLTDNTGDIILVNNAAAQSFRINPELALGRPASEIFRSHPLGDILTDEAMSLPASLELTTPTERVMYTNVSEIGGVGRVAVMQDITALKQIDRMRSQLLGTAAHDLKNPLNAIRLGADLLNDASLTEQQRKALSMMQRATDSMTNLITGLLETIRVESTANLSLEPCQINDLIRRGIEDLRPLAEAKGHNVSYEPPDEALLIMGDPNRLNSVMANLLSNAIKFTPRQGEIEIQVEWDDESVLVSVADNGPGIPEDEIPHIFEHFFRGRLSVEDPDNPVEGTGLGLALAKTVIEQHGGRVWVKSEMGEGTTFTFTLPREAIPRTGSLKSEDDEEQ